MADTPVIVPIQLQVTDLDLDNVNPGQVAKDLEKRLSGVRDAVKKVFSQIGSSSVNKEMSASLNSVKQMLSKAETAYESYQKAMIASGASSDEYIAKLEELAEAQKKLDTLKSFKEIYEDGNGKFKQSNGPYMYQEYIKASREYEAQLRKVQALEAEARPEEFANIGTDEAVQKMVRAYEKVVSIVSDLSQKEENLNKTIQENKMTDEYQKQQAEAEKLKAKMEELRDKSQKMSELGASDKQWESLEYDIARVNKEMTTLSNSMRKSVKDGSAFRFGGSPEEMTQQLEAIKQMRKEFSGNKTKATANVNTGLGQYSAEYKQQLADLSKLEEKIVAIKQKYDTLKASGASKSALDKTVQDAEILQTQLDNLTTRLYTTVEEGRAFRLGKGNVDTEVANITARTGEMGTQLQNIIPQADRVTQFFQSMGQKITTAIGTGINKLTAISPAFAKISAGAQKVVGAIANIRPEIAAVVAAGKKIASVIAPALKAVAQGTAAVARGFGKCVSAVGSFVSKAASALKHLNLFKKHGKSTTTDLSKGFKKLTKNIMMFGLGVRSAYYLIKRLRTTFVNAFKTLATQSDDVNQQLSRLVESFNRVKGGLVTAFQPLANVVIPILKSLCDYIYAAMEALGKFNATLTGQAYYYKTVANAADVAADAEGDRQKKLGSYDKLDVIQDNNNKGSTLDVTYEKADAEGAASDFAKMLKEAWAKTDFTDVGKVISDKIMALLDTFQNKYLPKITEFINKVTKCISTLLDGIDFEKIGGKVGTIISDFVKQLDFAQLGETIGKAKSSLWQFLYGLVSDIDWTTLGQKLAEGFTSLFNNLDFDSLVGFITTLGNGLREAIFQFVTNVDWADVARTLGEAINGIFTGIDEDGMKEGVGAVIQAIVTFAGEFIKTVDWDAIIDGLVEMFGYILQATAEALMESDNPIFQLFGELLASIKEVLDTIWPVIEQIVEALLPIVQSILPVISSILPPIAEIIAQVVQMILPVLVSLFQTLMPIIERIILDILPMIQQVLTALQPLFDVIVNTVLPFIAELLNAIWPLIAGILDCVTNILAPIMELLAPLIQIVFQILTPIVRLLAPILEMLGTLFSCLGRILGPIIQLITPLLEIISAILEPIISLISFLIDLIVSPLCDAISFVASLLTGIINGVLKIFLGLINTIKGAVQILGSVISTVFNTMRTAIQSFWNSIKGVLNAIISGFERLVNGVINGINGMIRALNSLSFEVPDWVPLIGGCTFGFHIRTLSNISIPRLAQGAVIPPNKEFLAMLGDQKSGTNIEAPLDTIKQALIEVLAETGGGSGNNAPIILQLDGKTVAEVVWSESEKHYKQTGVSAFAY